MGGAGGAQPPGGEHRPGEGIHRRSDGIDDDGCAQQDEAQVLKTAAVEVETLMFLPGASGNVDFWRPVADGLRHAGARRFFGWPGFGGAPPEPDVKGFGDLVTRVTREITGPVALLAQSMGGVIAMLAALEKPECVRSLVLSVTSGGIDLMPFDALDWRAAFRADDPRRPDWFATDRTDLTARLGEVQAPVLLLWGDADPISPVAVGRRLSELMPNAELVVLKGGTHDLVHERADEVIPLVQRHLERAG
jgi:pimeloyl-ACP methyl ester carboxylesterase